MKRRYVMLFVLLVGLAIVISGFPSNVLENDSSDSKLERSIMYEDPWEDGIDELESIRDIPLDGLPF